MPSPAHIAHLAAACAVAARAAARPAPRRQTVDQLRADLSHEMAAKHARLAALVREWRAGRRRERDAADATAICADIARLYLRHARVAAGSLRTFAELVSLLARLRSLARALREAARDSRPGTQAAALARCEQDLPQLVATARRFVEAISARHAARFAELVTEAAGEIRREAQAAGDGSVPVVLEVADGGVPAWVPRADAARWVDVLRNLVRNAVQAVEELPRAAGEGAPAAPEPVAVRLRPRVSAGGGARLEIVDRGVGMDAAQVAAMWDEGSTRHGDGHGQGLTAAKRAFVEARAALDIGSRPGAGTTLALDLPARDVTFAVPRWWAAPPLAIPAALALVLATGTLMQVRKGEIATIRITEEHIVTALDARGRTLWQRQFAERLRPNWHSAIQTDRQRATNLVPPLLVRDPRHGRLVVLVTAPAQGPGRVLVLDSRGRERWSRPLGWTPPKVTHGGNLTTAFQVATTWNDDGREVIVLNVRDGNWSSSSIQFLSTGGDSLGAYLHPGHLEFLASADIDGDGRVELVLNGKNNDAPREPAFWPGGILPDDAYGECLLALETPTVGGQAFPARRWDGVQEAREDAYLLLPPLRAEDFTDPRASAITHLVLGKPGADGRVRHEISLADGRIYVLDGNLRPLSCTAGDHTPAADAAPARASAPLLHFHQGRAESFDLPVERGS